MGAAYRAFEQLPAFIHTAGEDQDRSERYGGVESGLLVADSLALGVAAFPVGDSLVEAATQHVGGGHRGTKPGTLAIRARHAVQAVQRRLQRADAGIETIAEQVRDRDHARRQRGRRVPVTGAGGQVMGGPVGLRSGRVVVGGRGFVAERGEQCGPVQRRKLGRLVAHRPAVQLERLAMGRYASGLARGGDRVVVGEFLALPPLEMGRDERVAVTAFRRG